MKLLEKIQNIYHKASPQLRKRLIVLFSFLIIFNIAIWIFAFIQSMTYPLLLGLVVLSYGLGLRHAVDADHIAAIDNTTRKLMQDGKKPVAVGFFFSLGHSSIVVILSVLIAISSAFVKQNLPTFEQTGSLIGTSVSSFFLLVIGLINLIVLIDIFKIWLHVVKHGHYNESHLQEHLENRGLLVRIFRPFLKGVTNSWNMYFVGFLFGLGFDTASEVGLLSLSAATGAKGIPVYDIILLPLAFTAGMALVDSIDGVLMLGAYGWAYMKPIRKLYYNLNITFISVLIALLIGGIEALQIISGQLMLEGGFFTFINNLDFGNLGYFIIGTFVISWIISILIYRIKRYDLLEAKK